MTDYMPAVMREVNAKYEVDCLYTNGWPPLGNLPVLLLLGMQRTCPTGHPGILGEV